jgi:hypothetical protein
MNKRSFKEFQRNARAFVWEIRWGIVVPTGILILLVAAIWALALVMGKVGQLVEQGMEDKRAEWAQFSRKHNCHLAKDAIIYREYKCEDGTIYLKLFWED